MKGPRIKCVVLVGTFLWMNVAIGLCQAAVISTSDISLDSSPPTNIQSNAFDINGLWYFEEAQGATVTSNLTVDVGSGILAGTIVNSYFVYHDATSTQTEDGSITFDVDILGIIYDPGKLNASWFLERDSGHYYLYSAGDGYEAGDSAAISDSRTATFDTTSDSGEPDFARVITAVPLPSAVWLLGSVLLGVTGFRRKFNRS